MMTGHGSAALLHARGLRKEYGKEAGLVRARHYADGLGATPRQVTAGLCAA